MCTAQLSAIYSVNVYRTVVSIYSVNMYRTVAIIDSVNVYRTVVIIDSVNMYRTVVNIYSCLNDTLRSTHLEFKTFYLHDN